MLRRPSGSTDEDEPESKAAATGPASRDSKKGPFTTAKFDASRHSDTLDRRKVEKALLSNQLSPPEWSPTKAAIPSNIKQEQGTRASGEGSAAKENTVAMDFGEWRRPRLRSPWKCSLLTLAANVLSIALLLSIVNSFLTRHLDPKGCKNCLMRPIFGKFEGFDTEHTRFASKYSLHLYREAGVNEDLSVNGIPVLFITGNAGSHKQVRAIAAEAAYYFADHLQNDEGAAKSGVRNLDFFTADFNEDITAFHGQTLLDQAEYLNDAVSYILSLYHDPQRPRRDPGLPDPTSVIIIGHSMGGIVARTMLTMPNYQANSINTILTLSAPHARAPVSFDADIVSTYQRINNYWRQAYSQKWANDNPLWHVTLVSIAGGGLDTVVPSDYASLASLVPDTHGFTVFTSSIPGVWTGSDHLSILWCDQLRKVIVKSLFEIVDVRRSGQTKPRAERMRVFKRWFLTGMENIAEKGLAGKEPTTLLTLEDSSNTILATGERLVLRGLGLSEKAKTYLLPVPVPQEMPPQKKFTLMTNQRLDQGSLEVLFCSVFPLHPGQSASIFSMDMDHSGTTTGSTRLACKSANSDTISLPASTASSTFPFDETEPFSYLQYEVEDILEYQFVAVLDKSTSPVNGWLIAEFSENSHSQIQTGAGLGQMLTSGLYLNLPAGRPMMTDIKIPAIHSSLLVYNLRVGVQACADGALFAPFVRQYISEPYESKYFVNVKEADINIHGISPFMPPPLRTVSQNDGLSLQLWSDPTCGTSMEFSMHLDLFGSLGKLVMRYRTVFPAIPLVVIALVLRKQFVVHDQTGVFITFAESLDLCLRSSLPVLLLAMTFFSVSLAGSSSSTAGGFFSRGGNATESTIDYTKNDLILGSPDPFFWFLIPLSGLVGAGACVALNYAALTLVHGLRLLHSVATSVPPLLDRKHQRRSAGHVFSSASPRRRLAITLILFFMISTFIPYQFAYIVACVVQLITNTRALRAAQEARTIATYNFFNYTHSILVLMLWVLPINIPVLVVWVHNLAVHWLTPFSSHHNVLSIMPFVLLVESLTGGTMIPRVQSSFRHITNILFFILAVYAALYGVTYAYQLHHLANLICAWLVVVQLSNSGLSVSKLHQMLEGAGDFESDGHLKKRP